MVWVENRSHPGVDRDPPHDLRPGPQRQRLPVVAARLRQEQRPAGPADLRPVREIGRQQHAGRRRVRHHALHAVLGVLRLDPQRPPARVDVLGAEQAQLFPSQRSVIGQREHHPVPGRLVRRPPENGGPLPLVGDPRQLDQPGDEAALVAAELPAGRVLAAADGVGVAQAFLDEVVIEQADRDEPLLDRGVRQPGAGVDRDDVGTAAAGPAGQLADEHRDVGAVGRGRVDVFPLADVEVLGQAAGIRVDRPGRPSQVSPDPQPPGTPARAGLAPATSPRTRRRARTSPSSYRPDRSGCSRCPVLDST